MKVFPDATEPSASALYRLIPSVHDVLARAETQVLIEQYGSALVTEAARTTLAVLRQRLGSGELDAAAAEQAVSGLGKALRDHLDASLRPRLRRVINATGVLLQTNLGRAPLSEAAIERIAEVARGYCNLEFDLAEGVRSKRDVLAEDLILQMLQQRATSGLREGKLAAAVVNNCAAATFLGLNTLAEGGEVIVSRGELVEIGGGFRIPEILAKSGAVLREVGTTNKTRIGDYATAIGPQTKLILRVHRSNFRIEGFTEQPSLRELVDLGNTAAIPVFDDQGTGRAVDLAPFGMQAESSWVRSVESGAALIACSGDKLLGGPQCGLMVGSSTVIEGVRRNPLYRALRVDKLTYAALEATLLAYLAGKEQSIPVIGMMHLDPTSIRERCERLASTLRSSSVLAEVTATTSVVGGGTTPGASLPSFAVSLRDERRSESDLAALLRGLDPPVVARVRDGRVLLDLRTVSAELDQELTTALCRALQEPASR